MTLRQRMREAGFSSDRELASECGVNRSTVWRWHETGAPHYALTIIEQRRVLREQGASGPESQCTAPAPASPSP